MEDKIKIDEKIEFHKSFYGLLDSFRATIAALNYLQTSPTEAKKHFALFPYLIELPCCVTNKVVKIDKTILDLVEKEGYNKEVPLYSKTLIDFYRIFTIAVKDIIWQEQDFKSLLLTPELNFLKHLRNASAHRNKFYFGEGKERLKVLSQLPILWKNKEINEMSEGNDLYMDFMKPGDLFILLSDISKLVKK